MKNIYEKIDLNEAKKNRKDMVLGDILASRYYRVMNNYKTGLRFEQVTVFSENKNYVLVDTINNRKKNWTFTDEKKQILGYECKQAFLMDDEGLQQIVWYTTALNCNFSEDGELGLDGVILEKYYPRAKAFTTAIDIEKDAKNIIPVIYNKGQVLTPAEFSKKRKK